VPIYEYRCSHCKHDFEELVRFECDETKLKCPKCGKGKVARRLSVFSARNAPAQSSPRVGPCGGCCAENGTCPMAE